ncbi:hypothetical protein CAPTEDRAFT_94947, partial [Capitella teleta]
QGERKGTNKYYPPDFDPVKHRNLAGYTGQHPLRERARKLHLGILVIRFEMPYNIWCDGCNSHIGMGVRYNAEKSKIGMYYTTPIYKFRMKCHLCPSHMEIKTDPANHDYVIISGARRKEQRWDPKDNEQIVPEDRNDQKKMATDAMFKLEHGANDKDKASEAKSSLAHLTNVQAFHKDDFGLNQLARSKFRTEKKALHKLDSEDDALLKKSSLNVPLVEEHDDDVRMAKLIKYSTSNNYSNKQKERRDAIHSRPLFHRIATATKSPSSTKERQIAEVKKSVQTAQASKLNQAFDEQAQKNVALKGIVREKGKSGGGGGASGKAEGLRALCDYDSSSSSADE